MAHDKCIIIIIIIIIIITKVVAIANFIVLK